MVVARCEERVWTRRNSGRDLPEVLPPHVEMVRWYDPSQLLRTGTDVIVSEMLGRHADPRCPWVKDRDGRPTPGPDARGTEPEPIEPPFLVASRSAPAAREDVARCEAARR